MKHARIAWSGAIHDAVEADGQLLLTQGPHAGRRVGFDEVVWLPPLAPVPQARTVIALGLAGRLVGVTRYDAAPEVKALPRVGGFLDPSPEAVLGLRPDLVLWLADHR